MRFGALRRQVEGISSRVLTERLRVLENEGFVHRDYHPSIPPAVTYGLTRRMKEIREILSELDTLARKWQQQDRRAQPSNTASGRRRGRQFRSRQRSKD